MKSARVASAAVAVVATAAAVVTAVLAHRLNALTAWGAQLYVWARLVYLPLYAFGVPWLRSLVWAVAWVGVVLILAGLVYP